MRPYGDKKIHQVLRERMSMVSVFIPTFNAGPTLRLLLEGLEAQSVPCTAIVADSSSSDETISVARSYNAHILQIRKEDFNHGRTRNLAASVNLSEIMVFMTQDAVPWANDCIEQLLRPLKDSKVVASYGRQLPRPDASPVEQFTRLFNYPDRPAIKELKDLPGHGIKTFFFSNVCSAIKIKEFKELGGFPENIIMFEDLIFAAKAILKGYKIAYAPEARVWHSHKFSLVQQFQRYRDAGLSLRNNAWIFEHARANREGADLLRKQIGYLLSQHQYIWIPYAIAESVFKFAGFWLGLHGAGLQREAIAPSSVSVNA